MWRFIGHAILVGCIGYLLFGYVVGSIDPINGYDMVGLHLRIYQDDRGQIWDLVPLGLLCGYACLFLVAMCNIYITQTTGKKDTIGFTVVSAIVGYGNIGCIVPYLPVWLCLPFEFYNEMRKNHGWLDTRDSLAMLLILFVLMAGLICGLFWLLHVWKRPKGRIAAPTLIMLCLYSITAVSVVNATFSFAHLDNILYRQFRVIPWGGYAILGSSLFLGYYSLHTAHRLMGLRVSSAIIGLVMLGMLICGLVWYFAGLGWAILCAVLLAVLMVIIVKVVLGKIMKLIAWAKSLDNVTPPTAS